MDGIAQINEAETRLHNAAVALRRFDMDVFTEMEVRFRLETIINMLIIIQSDLRNMKDEWTTPA